MPSFFPSSVHPVHAADLVFSEPIAPMSVICLAPVQPVIANYLCLGPFYLISSGFCIFSSLGPISLIMIILTHILVQVLCVSSIAKTLYWNMAWDAIFATISPFLVIDDNTTKASKMNCKNMKLIPIWKVRDYLACLDDISMLILKATGIWNWYQL